MSRLSVRLSAREVVAFREPFRPSGDELSDASVARDEIAWLASRVSAEPVVIRATASGGRKRDREVVHGDWLCEPGGRDPVRLPTPRWLSGSRSLAWAGERTAIDAWEWCDDGRWLIGAAVDVGVPRVPAVLAACDCARMALRAAPSAESEPERAVAAAERWAAGAADMDEVRRAAGSAELSVARLFRASSAAAAIGQAAYDRAAACRVAAEAAVFAAGLVWATSAGAAAQAEGAVHSSILCLSLAGVDAETRLADEVRRRISTVEYLRAESSR